MFLYYTNEGSDDAIGHSTKQCNTQSRTSLEIKTWHQKCTSQLKKQNFESYVSGPVLRWLPTVLTISTPEEG